MTDSILDHKKLSDEAEHYLCVFHEQIFAMQNFGKHLQTTQDDEIEPHTVGVFMDSIATRAGMAVDGFLRAVGHKEKAWGFCIDDAPRKESEAPE
jgi:hypothetical protein